ncbi:MAG: peptidase E [Alphaproteobacteria bacterium]|nr:peptidase E [Alphaproteobacteria bacterium]MCB9695622.1 peptidase E [Alphaproteobacteria bacterium]
MRPTIVAIGGGGFSMEPEHPVIDEWILGLTGVARPRVCFVPTASGDADGYVQRFYTAFEAMDARPSHLSLFRRTGADLRELVLRQHVIYVGGGNTPNLLAVWRVHGLDVILREAYARGVLLAGISAGALCWFEGGVTDGFGGYAPLCDGLGLLRGSFCPHWDGEPERQEVFHRAIAQRVLPEGIAADDGAAVRFVDGAPAEVHRSRPGARALRITAGGVAPL